MAVPSGSNALMLMEYLSPGFNFSSGPSHSHNEGSSPLTRTSGGPIFRILRMRMSVTFDVSACTVPQRIAWPFVPPKPKEETWTLFCELFEAATSLVMHMSNWACSKFGFKTRKWLMADEQPDLTWSTAAMSVVMAAPPSKWPVCVLLVRSSSVVSLGSFVCTRRTPPTSMGSPKEVPVPWQFQMQDSGGRIRASRMALVMTSSCARPFGAVSVAERPFWPTREARQMASRSSGRSPYLSVRPEQPSPRM
mmetsp:Transcript_50744/g.142616  ORF Transcript_50744/g.142616 Transcript_50744/m.142616 type:complete len:250 (+) Transcript_50744:138-887(+)